MILFHIYDDSNEINYRVKARLGDQCGNEVLGTTTTTTTNSNKKPPHGVYLFGQ